MTAAPVHDAPSPDIVEFSLFGPMFGECIVIHYGDGQWMTIDSCLEDDANTPSALAYLNEIGVSHDAVTHCVVTHADADHLGGIGRLFASCSRAELVCSSVMSSKEMSTYLTYFSKTNPKILSGALRELHDALLLSFNRPPGQPRYVKEDVLVISSAGMRVTALSPSNTKISKFLNAVIVPKKGSPPKAPALPNPNAVSAALLFEWGGCSAIMGADLDEAADHGWSQLMASSVAFKNSTPASLLKVPHHGSPGADHPPLWAWMTDALAILAPFKFGRHKLPARDDVGRILKNTQQAFSSGSYPRKGRPLSTIDKGLYLHGIVRTGLFGKNGHVRVRFQPDGAREVALFGNAVHLSKVH